MFIHCTHLLRSHTVNLIEVKNKCLKKVLNRIIRKKFVHQKNFERTQQQRNSRVTKAFRWFELSFYIVDTQPLWVGKKKNVHKNQSQGSVERIILMLYKFSLRYIHCPCHTSFAEIFSTTFLSVIRWRSNKRREKKNLQVALYVSRMFSPLEFLTHTPTLILCA